MSSAALRRPAGGGGTGAGTRPVALDPVARVRAVGHRAARRRGLVVAGLAAALVVVAVASLAVGDVILSPGAVVAALVGRGSPLADFVVLTLRLPRLVTAALVGAALALAGSLFQTSLRNPLASPDVLGVAGGASAGAVAARLVLGLDGLAVPLAAALGGAAVAAATAALSWRTGGTSEAGGLSGQRFVLVGVAASFVAGAVLNYLLTRADVRLASSAFVWLVGSVGDPDWGEAGALAVVLAVLGPVAGVLARPLALLGLGADTARGLGVRAGTTTVVALAVGVLLAAAAVAVAGPVAFVALTCAPVVRRLSRADGLLPVGTALAGALLVSAADLLAQHLPGGGGAPVGLVTGLLGAPYLLWLLGAQRRRGAL